MTTPKTPSNGKKTTPAKEVAKQAPAAEKQEQPELPYFQRLGWASKFYMSPLPKNFGEQLWALETDADREQAISDFLKGDFKGAMDLQKQMLNEPNKVIDRVQKRAQEYADRQQQRENERD